MLLKHFMLKDADALTTAACVQSIM